MVKMKKIILLAFLIGLMIFSLTACNSSVNNRETKITGETKDTVDFTVPQAQQSVAKIH